MAFHMLNADVFTLIYNVSVLQVNVLCQYRWWRLTVTWHQCMAERHSSSPISTFHRDVPALGTLSVLQTTNDLSKYHADLDYSCVIVWSLTGSYFTQNVKTFMSENRIQWRRNLSCHRMHLYLLTHRRSQDLCCGGAVISVVSFSGFLGEGLISLFPEKFFDFRVFSQ